MGSELSDWVRRIFLVPLLVSAASFAIETAGVQDELLRLSLFLDAAMLAWLLNTWASYLLGRQREFASDLYAIEVTRTPEAFAEGLTKLTEADEHNLVPNLFDTLGLFSHPCLTRRPDHLIRALEAKDRPRRSDVSAA